jgi:hypothetical protein
MAKPTLPQADIEELNLMVQAVEARPNLSPEARKTAMDFIREEYQATLEQYDPPAEQVGPLDYVMRALDLGPGIARIAGGAITGLTTTDDLKEAAVGSAPSMTEILNRGNMKGQRLKLPGTPLHLPASLVLGTVADVGLDLTTPGKALAKRFPDLAATLSKRLGGAADVGRALENPVGIGLEKGGEALYQVPFRNANRRARLEGAQEPGQMLREAQYAGTKEGAIGRLGDLSGDDSIRIDELLIRDKNASIMPDPIFQAEINRLAKEDGIGGQVEASQKVIQALKDERPNFRYSEGMPLITADQMKRRFQQRARKSKAYADGPDLLKTSPGTSEAGAVEAAVRGEASKNVARKTRGAIQEQLGKGSGGPDAAAEYGLRNERILGSMIGQDTLEKELSAKGLRQSLESFLATPLATHPGRLLGNHGREVGKLTRPALIHAREDREDERAERVNPWKLLMQKLEASK